MLKLTDYLYLGSAKYKEDFVGLRILEDDIIPIGGGRGPSYIDVLLSGVSPLVLTNAISLNYLKLFGGTEQRNLPDEYTQVNYVTNTARTVLDTGVKFDFSKNYEIELKVRGVVGSWYILQAKETGGDVWGFSGSQSGQTIRLGFGDDSATSQITRVVGNIYYLKGTVNNGNLTLYVKDETAGTEDTATGTYTVTTGQSVNICLFGNLASQYVDINSDVYFARIKEDGNYIMNYVPCRQVATAGFYDKVSGTFKTANDLVADGNTVPTPDTPMDIICNNGVIKVSPNLFNKDTLSAGYISDEGVITSSTTSAYSTPIPVSPNTTYILSGATIYSGNAALRVHGYTSGDVWTAMIKKVSTSSPSEITSPVVFTTGSTDYFIRISYIQACMSGIQVEYGSSPTPYMPYGQIYTDGTTEIITITNGGTANAEMLLKVGTYQDNQELLTGNVVRNVGIKVLNGTEEWGTSTKYCWNLLSETRTTLDVYCTHFKMEDTIPPSSAGGSARWGKMFASSYGLAIGARASEASEVSSTVFATVDDWKQYLANQYNAGTPVIIVYPLTTSTTETVRGQSLTASGNCTVTATGSLDNLSLEVSYKAAAQVTITEVQNSQLSNNVEVTIND